MAEENQRSKTKIVYQGETVHDSVYCCRSIYKNIYKGNINMEGRYREGEGEAHFSLSDRGGGEI